MSRRIIGIMGNVGSGKDTCGDYLVQKHGFVKVSFAKRVKDVANAVFGWDRNMLEGSSKESRAWREEIDPYWGFSPRYALQMIGTELFRRHIDPDVWVKAVKKEIEENLDTNYVITDCRFENELEAIRAMGGTIIYIERGRQPVWSAEARAGKPFSEDYDIHITDWNSYALSRHADHEIINNGTLDELVGNIERILASYS